MFKHLRRLLSDSVVYGLAGVIRRFVTLFLIPLYTKALTPEDYGVMSLTWSSMSLIGTLAGLSLFRAVHRFYWDTPREEERLSYVSTAFWSCCFTSALAAAGIIALAGPLSTAMFHRDDAALVLQLAALNMALDVLPTTVQVILQAQRRPWFSMNFALAHVFTQIALTALFVLYFGWGTKGIFGAALAATAMQSLVCAVVFWKWIDPRRIEFSRLKPMLTFSLPFIPAMACLWIVQAIDRYFIDRYLSLSSVGVYEIGNSLAAGIQLGTTAFAQAWLPFAMSIEKENDSRKIYAQAFLGYMWLGCLGCTALSLLAPELLWILTTKSYHGAEAVVPFLAFKYLLIGVVEIAALGVTIQKQTRSVGWAMMFAAGLNIALNFLLVPTFKMEGAAVAAIVANAVSPLVLFMNSQRVYPIPYRFGAALVLVASAVGLIVGGRMLGDGITLLIVAQKVGLILFFFALPLLLGIVTLDDLKRLRAKLSNRRAARSSGAEKAAETNEAATGASP